MPTTANNETLERIRAGKLAIENDGTEAQLREACNPIISFPINERIYSGGWLYLDTAIWVQCYGWSGKSIKATDLIVMIKENVYEVYYNGEWHIETEENYKELVNNANCYGRINRINQGDIINAIHSDTEEKEINDRVSELLSNKQSEQEEQKQKELKATEDELRDSDTKKAAKSEPVSSDTQEELWRELIDIYDVTDRDSEGYGSLIKVLSESFTIQRNPSLGPNQ